MKLGWREFHNNIDFWEWALDQQLVGDGQSLGAMFFYACRKNSSTTLLFRREFYGSRWILLWSQGTSCMHQRGFHYLIFILTVERILLLALISSRTAASSRNSVWVSRRRSVRRKDAPRGCGWVCPCVCLSLPLRGSICLRHRRWICYLVSKGSNR